MICVQCGLERGKGAMMRLSIGVPLPSMQHLKLKKHQVCTIYRVTSEEDVGMRFTTIN